MPPRAPSGLSPKARSLWSQTTKTYDLRTDELRVLEEACRELDLVERIDKELRAGDLLVRGSMGQEVPNPLLQEIRQHRTVMARLLNQLHLPEEEEGSGAGKGRSSSAARDLANARWRRGA